MEDIKEFLLWYEGIECVWTRVSRVSKALKVLRMLGRRQQEKKRKRKTKGRKARLFYQDNRAKYSQASMASRE